MSSDGAQNLVVATRVRPLSSKEKSRGCEVITNVNVKDNSITIGTTNKEPKTFTFDHCYDDAVTQEKVYEDLGAPLVSKSLEGYNSTIFAFGQTGSGKTYSIMGEESHDGLLPRLAKDLFLKIDQKLQLRKESGVDTKYLVTVSFLELYDEKNAIY